MIRRTSKGLLPRVGSEHVGVLPCRDDVSVTLFGEVYSRGRGPVEVTAEKCVSTSKPRRVIE